MAIRPVGVERWTPAVPEQVEPTPSHFVDRYLFLAALEVMMEVQKEIRLNSTVCLDVLKKGGKHVVRTILHLFLWLRLCTIFIAPAQSPFKNLKTSLFSHALISSRSVPHCQ